MIENVIIIGSGCAGLSAAIYTAREGFNPLVIGGAGSGGQLMLTTAVENYPGFPDGVQGPELIERMSAQAQKFGARIVLENVIDVDLSKKPYKITTESGLLETKSIIIATGASARMLGLPSENKYIGHGVSTCGTCDAPFFKNKDVAVVGGGDTAMEDASFLTKFANHVTLIHRRDAFRASSIMQKKIFDNHKIKTIMNSTVTEILGDEKSVTGLKIENIVTKEQSTLEVQGVFITIGSSPNSAFLKGSVKTDEAGFIIAKDEVFTNVDGVFVAGDVSDRFYKQAATASGSGVKAALRVREYLASLA
jgi:thioredoxin reductase (NADPH)